MGSVSDREVDQLFQECSTEIRDLATQAWALIADVMPEAVEEVDRSARMLAFTFQPGTYKGLVVGLVLQKSYVNIMFSRGVELLEVDTAGLLEGTGKVARHVEVRDVERLKDPSLRQLIAEAAARTPRA